MNILVLALICFGTAAPHTEADALEAVGSAGAIVDDLPPPPVAGKQRGRTDAPLPPPPPPPDPLLLVMQPLFGQNTSKVKAIFTAWTAYAAVASAHNEKWTSSTQEYRDERARRAYWAGACALARLMTTTD